MTIIELMNRLAQLDRDTEVWVENAETGGEARDHPGHTITR
jgi:hypothetical protein